MAERVENSSEPALQVEIDHIKLDFEKWKAEEELKLKRDELDAKRNESSKSVWSSPPLLVAALGLFATILASIVQNYFQSAASRELERQRFESTLIQKALDTDSPEEAAQRLKFLASIGLITDENGKITSFIKNPDSIPVQPVANCITPGKARWSVKTGSDPDADLVGQAKYAEEARIQLDRQGRAHTTVDDLVSLPRPDDMQSPMSDYPAYDQHRARPAEYIIWTLEADIISHKQDVDGDYVLVIQGASEQTMVAEVPYPAPPFVDPSSRWAKDIAAVREKVRNKLNPQPQLQKASVRARITGIGFFDRVHGQIGVAGQNGIELHPVIDIEFP